MSYETITYEVQDAIATITLNRPDQLNALDAAMERELLGIWDRVDQDDEVRAVIVTGNGRAFCAGFDLSEQDGFDVMQRARERGTEEIAEGDIPRDSGGLIAVRMFSCLKPIIGAINGVGVGFGATFPLPMDIRMAADSARFGFVFSRRGICMDAASSWFLPRAVGLSKALEWSLSGRIFDADEALSAGLVHSLYSSEALMPAAREMAESLISDSAPVSVAINRQLLWNMAGAQHPMDAHWMESVYIAERGPAADAAEGAASFLEKRPPSFPMTVSGGMPRSFPLVREPKFEQRSSGQ